MNIRNALIISAVFHAAVLSAPVPGAFRRASTPEVHAQRYIPVEILFVRTSGEQRTAAARKSSAEECVAPRAAPRAMKKNVMERTKTPAAALPVPAAAQPEPAGVKSPPPAETSVPRETASAGIEPAAENTRPGESASATGARDAAPLPSPAPGGDTACAAELKKLFGGSFLREIAVQSLARDRGIASRKGETVIGFENGAPKITIARPSGNRVMDALARAAGEETARRIASIPSCAGFGGAVVIPYTFRWNETQEK
ncbi:MAG: hypothetical protein AB1742_00820 [bacterium]